MAPLASQMSSPVAATRTAATPPSSKPTTTPAQVPLARPRSQSLELASSTSLPERDESPPRLAVEPPSPPRPMPLPLQQGDADSHTSQPSSAPSSTFSINVPPPPVPVPRLLLHSIVVPSVNVDPHEEFLINPAEFRVQSVSRITAPAGRVVYEVVFQDGHSAEWQIYTTTCQRMRLNG
ncbi:hypothetical protein DFH27DRAFT_398088 [Peziza echinospora]|nr:hypothetical protein DFH27DRAFT_398088 [Peziza echinospora]